MDGFSVTINIIDEVCECNCRNRIEKTVTITSTSQQIELQCCYFLNIIRVTDTYFTIIIQNGIRTIIRNIYTDFPTQICIPDKCVQHLVTISGQINTV